MQRRSFLAGLLSLPAAGVVAREVTRAEPAGAKYAKALARSVRGQLPTYGQYLTSKDAWHLPDWPGSVNVKTYHRTSSRVMTPSEIRADMERVCYESFMAAYRRSGL